MKTSLAALMMASALVAGCGQPVVRGALVTVTGTADVKAAPDVAVITTGVQRRGATAKAAQDAMAKRMSEIVASVSGQGVKAEDVQTSQLNLQPITNWADGRQRIVGYESVNTVTIKVRDLAKVSDVLDAVVADGANRIDWVGFIIEDPAKQQSAAYQEAVKRARARADSYAAGAGLKVHRLISLTEPGGMIPPMPIPAGAVMAEQAVARNAAAPTVAPGQITTAASVTAVYELR
jgi:uncharacterized protein